MRESSALARVLSAIVPLTALLAVQACAVEPSPDDEIASEEAASQTEACHGIDRYTVDEAFSNTPFAIGHRGSGVNLGEDPSRPIENTLPAFHQAFADGARMVELDVQLTKDGHVVVYHDDFLPDYTCINTLTRHQLRQKAPEIPTLKVALGQAKLFNLLSRDGSGLVMVELKPPSPLCDPDDTGDIPLSDATVQVIRKTRMTEQVVLTSFSPTMLATASQVDPAIDTALDLNALQLLPAEVVEQLTGLPVTEITKPNGLGLRWAEVGLLYRLPGYGAVEEFLGTAYSLGCYATLLDRLVPLQAPSQTPALIQGIHGLGMKAVVWTVNDAPEWQFFQAAGVDAIVTDDVPLGVSLQAP